MRALNGRDLKTLGAVVEDVVLFAISPSDRSRTMKGTHLSAQYHRDR